MSRYVPLTPNSRTISLMPNLPPQVKLRNYIIKENRPIARGIFELVLENNDGEPIPPFLSGQWVGLHLLNPDGTEWARAAYSIATTPSHGVREIVLGIKVEKDFTKRASELKPGDRVMLQGPFGVFTIKPDAERLVMFAGGIGITPILSMIRDLAGASHQPETTLFYSGKACDSMAYWDEIKGYAKTCPWFKLVGVCTEEADPDWEGETKRVDIQMMDAHIKDYSKGLYLLCGPRSFMDSLTEILYRKGVLKSQIRKELFS